MRATGPLHPRREDGSRLDATFELSAVPLFELVFHNKAGARGSARSVNVDYHEALEVLLARLAALRATIVGIRVDSSTARELDPPDRELQLEFPIDLSPETNAYELRLEITRAQKSIARRSTAKPGGGNDQKRIRITLALDRAPCEFEHLVQLLISPG